MSNKHTNWAFWLSIVAIVISTTILVLWMISVSEIAVVQLDTFVGVIVALMALLVTIVLGWQIYNAVDIQDKIKSIEGLKRELEQSKILFKQADIKNAFYHNLSLALCSQITKDYISAFRFFEQALMHTLQLDEPVNVPATLSSLSNCATLITKEQTIPNDKYKEIMKADKTIRASKYYTLIQVEYEKSFKTAMSKVHSTE